MFRVRLGVIAAAVCLLASLTGMQVATARHQPAAVDPTPDHVFKAFATTSAAVTVSTTGPELLVAFVSSDATSMSSPQTASVSGGGLTWTLTVRENVKAGDAEIWTANGTLSTAPITAREVAQTGTNIQLTVAAFQQAGVAATGKNAAVGPPTVSVVASKTGSNVYAVGMDYDNAVLRTPSANNVVDAQNTDSIGDTYWVQHNSVTTTTGQSSSVSDAAPAGDQYNYAAVEVASTGAPPPTTTTTMATTTTVPPTTTTLPPTTTTTVPVTTTTTTTPPPPPGFPDSTNTGVPAGTTLIAVPGALTSGPGWHWDSRGWMVVDGPGAVLDALDVGGVVDVFADNVTISRTRIHASGYYVVKTYDGATYFKNLTISDTELDGQGVLADTSIAVMGTQGAQIIRANIHGMTSSGPRLATGEIVRDSWIHSFVCGPGIHQAGMSANDGGSNIVVRHNNLDINTTDGGCASFAFELALDFGYYTNVIVDQNLLNGGAYCTQAGVIAPQNQYSGKSTYIQYTNNTFGRIYRPECGEFGPVSEWGTTTGNVWTGNIWGGGAAATSSHQTGDPVTP